MISSTVESEAGAELEGGTEDLLSTENEGVLSSMSACSRVPNSQLGKKIRTLAGGASRG